MLLCNAVRKTEQDCNSLAVLQVRPFGFWCHSKLCDKARMGEGGVLLNSYQELK